MKLKVPSAPGVLFALAGAGALALALVWSSLSRDLDGFLADFTLRTPKTLTKVLDRNGDVLGVFAEEHRVVIPFGDMPRAFVGAVIATEDADFMRHDGLSPRGVARAGYNFLASFGRRREGASTLTMQLVRTVTAKRQRRLDRKLKEIILARRLERAFTKKQIFEAYANEVYFGGGRYGLEAASRYYFGKGAPELAVEECALLAGLIQNPNRFHPYRPDPEARAAAKARRDHVLKRMAAEGYLKAGDARALMDRPLRLDREQAQDLAPYAVEEVRKYLYAKYGRARVLEGGLEVTTTLDAIWQTAANEAVREGLLAVERRRGSRPGPKVEGALLAVEPQTGEIRAMVGGSSFTRSRFNRSLQARRQAGSTLKPFVYGAAFTQGMTPATLVEDVPTRFLFHGAPYVPRNFEGDFRGTMPIWEAIRVSRNLPAVRTLEAAGIEPVLGFARRTGLGGRLQAYPSLALGASEVTLKDLVQSYGTFALGGRLAPPPFLIKRIIDQSGKVLEAHAGRPGDQVVDPMSNYQLVQCLQGLAQRGTGARSNALAWPLAGKTGTTNDFADTWYLGFSTRLVCGVWVGLDARKTLFPGACGSTVALPIWVEFMKTALPGTPREPFPAPEGMDWADVDRTTGLVATEATPEADRVRLAFKPGTAPEEPSTPEAVAAAAASRAQAAALPLGDLTWGSTEASLLD